jgi:hypothetical protein
MLPDCQLGIDRLAQVDRDHPVTQVPVAVVVAHHHQCLAARLQLGQDFAVEAVAKVLVLVGVSSSKIITSRSSRQACIRASRLHWPCERSTDENAPSSGCKRRDREPKQDALGSRSAARAFAMRAPQLGARPCPCARINATRVDPIE